LPCFIAFIFFCCRNKFDRENQKPSTHGKHTKSLFPHTSDTQEQAENIVPLPLPPATKGRKGEKQAAKN
jgi:hypothetical protein